MEPDEVEEMLLDVISADLKVDLADQSGEEVSFFFEGLYL